MESKRMISEGGESSRPLLEEVMDGVGGLVGDSEKDLLMNEDLEEDLCLDFDLTGEVELILVSCCEVGVGLGGPEGLDDDLCFSLSGLGEDLSLVFMGDNSCGLLTFSSVVLAGDFGLLGGEGAGCLL